MSDDIDVEAMLEAPYQKDDVPKSSSRYRDRSRSRSKDRSRRRRDHSGERRKDRDDRKSERRREKDREFGRNDIVVERRRERDDRGPRQERSRPERRPREKLSPRLKLEDSDNEEPKRFYRNGEPRPRSPELTPEERDARTVFVWQLSARIRQRDLEDFFTSVGKIRDVRLIMDGKTKRSKGIAYVEFREVESAQLALGLTGTRLLGVPIQIQQSHAEKNRLNAATPSTPAFTRAAAPSRGPMKLYVGSLHYNITEDMLKGIFEPFGKLDDIKLIKDPSTNRSQGYGFVTYTNGDDARKALDQLNGFDLAGRAMKVNYVTEKSDFSNLSALDNEEADRSGIDLGTTGRLALMAKLAEGTGLEIPKAALAQLQGVHGNPTLGTAGKVSSSSATAPPVCTQCFMLSNMFDPHTASHTTFEEIRDDVIAECSLLGGILHLFVDRTGAQGNVYVKCPSIAIATQCVNKLHGRYFSGRLVTAAYVPIVNYHQLFPDSITANTILKPSFDI